MPSDKWAKARAHEINAKLAKKYGAGWQHMSADQQTNAYRSEILVLIMQQDLEQYEPAQELVDKVSAALEA